MTPRYFSARLVKGGPVIGVRLFFGPPVIDGEEQDRSHRLNVLIDAERTSRYVWQLAAGGEPVDVDGRTLLQCKPIDEAEYQFLTARARWATEHNPYHPAATPREAVDWQALKPIF